MLSLLQIGQRVSKTGVLSKITSRESLALLDGYECKHEYTIELMSFDPLVIYANNFVSNAEINHLLETTKESWNHSLIYHRRGDKFLSEVDQEYRTSQSAMISLNDPVSKCLSLVKYNGGERFRIHQDWLVVPQTNSFNSDSPAGPFNRLF
ncbi:hypothetical protein N7527_001682 [Penicillium freii]|nr:hypothetical protein N7527_001682 [Penicillium freii]